MTRSPDTGPDSRARRASTDADAPREAAVPSRKTRRRSVLLGVGCLALVVAVATMTLVYPTHYGGSAIASVWSPKAADAPRASSPGAEALSPYRNLLAPNGGYMLTARFRQLASPRIASVPVTIPLRPGLQGVDSDLFTYGGVSYEDPTAGGVPLQWVEGEDDTWLTPGFTLRDFAPRDGASLARIAPELVEGLERLRLQAGRVAIISGYRHPYHNVAVGGSGHSLHTAGKAADVWSPDHTPLALARLALLTMGCDVGVGLGPRTIHVDVRGELTTWTYEGAALSNAAFDAWALTQCGRPVPSGLAQAAAAAWLDDSTASATPLELDSASAFESFDGDLSPEALLDRYADDVADAARRGYTLEGPGGVIVDMTNATNAGIRYVRASSPEAAALGLAPLISWCIARGSDTYVAYAVITADGVTTGIMNVGASAGLRSSSSPAATTRDLGASATQPPSPAEPGRAHGGSSDHVSSAVRPHEAAHPSDRPNDEGDTWAVVVASLRTRDAAQEKADDLRDQIVHVGTVSVVAAPSLGRYRVTVGPYSSAQGARRALAELGQAVTEDAWIIAL